MRTVLSLFLLFFSVPAVVGQVDLPRELRVRVGRLAKVEAVTELKVRWLNLNQDLDMIADSSGRWVIILGHRPGTFRIACFVCGKDGPAEPSYCDVIVEGAAPPSPTPPGNPVQPNPARATCRLRFGSSGCTATLIERRDGDQHWRALTAAHCCGSVGAKGSITLPDGRTAAVTVVSRNTRADLAWLRLDDASLAGLPFARLAASHPPIGARVWHCGYGVDRPGNTETGNVTALPDSNGQIRFLLSVSSGDSGSGIFLESTGELVGVVCCTASRGSLASMWGGSSVEAAKIYATGELEHPVRYLPPDSSDAVEPTEIPLRLAKQKLAIFYPGVRALPSAAKLASRTDR